MCASCWMSLDHPTIYNARVGIAAGLINDLYRVAPTGGPLHAVVDDWNVEDGDLVVHQAYNDAGLPYWSVETLGLAEQVALLMRTMTTAERVSTLAHQEGFLYHGRPTATGEAYLETHQDQLADDPELDCACRLPAAGAHG